MMNNELVYDKDGTMATLRDLWTRLGPILLCSGTNFEQISVMYFHVTSNVSHRSSSAYIFACYLYSYC